MKFTTNTQVLIYHLCEARIHFNIYKFNDIWFMQKDSKVVLYALIQVPGVNVGIYWTV